MGIFSTSSPFDEVVTKATSENNTKDDWSLILDICDKVCTSQTAPKECLRAIVKRLHHQDPHVVLQAITLLDACVSNCHMPFHLEIASREFEQEVGKLLTKSQDKLVRDKLLGCLQKWANNEFKTDPQLNLIPSLVNSLKSKGLEFPNESPLKSKKSGHHHHHRSRDASGPAPAQEDADLAKAIELSLKETQAGQQSKSLYPQASSLPSSSGGGGFAGYPSTSDQKEPTKVRALYDFEAAEDNELTFYSGEIVFVTDDSDPHWWQGSNQRGKGLFPANFVTTDISAEPTKLELGTKKGITFNEDVEVRSIKTEEPEVVEIDEAKADHVLHLLHEADPTGEVEDPHELGVVEEQVNQMGPLIDQELEKIDRRHAQLTRLGGELVEALNMYHNLMRDPVGMPPMSMPYGMKMGQNIPASTNSMPHFPAGGPGPMQYPSYPNAHFDPNAMYAMMRPPLSSPASNGSGYNTAPYQSLQNNGAGHQQQQQPNPAAHMQNSMVIPNGLQQIPTSHQGNHTNMQMPPSGQPLMHQAAMMAQGYDSSGMQQQPQMSVPQSGAQQYNPPVYSQQPATPNAP